MARLPVIVGITHNPFHPRLSSRPRSEWNEHTAALAERGERMREVLRQARVDGLVMVGNDHFHQFFMDNMPAFCLGKMETYDGTFYNEEREFRIPRCLIPGDLALSRAILEAMLRRGVDLAFSDELKLDHSIVVPLRFVRPELDLPVVPLLSNLVAPPLPTARRFYDVGRALRAAIEEDLPTERRIGVVVSGNLSLDVGGPTMFERRPADAAFDDQAFAWVARGEAEAAIRECTPERLLASGNVTFGFLNYVLLMGVANGAPATYADELKRAGSTHPVFAWELK